MINVIPRDNLGDGFVVDTSQKKIHVGGPPVYFSATNPLEDKYINGRRWSGFGGSHVSMFSAGDKIEIYVYADGSSVQASTRTHANYCGFSAVKIG